MQSMTFNEEGNIMTTHETIQNARKAKGMTQQQLADMVGMTQGNIARIESGRHCIRLDKLELIANALGIKIVIG